MGNATGTMPEWLNANAHRAFPFYENARRPIPDWALLDFRAFSCSDWQGGPANDDHYIPCSLDYFKIELAPETRDGLFISMRFKYYNQDDLEISTDEAIPFGETRRLVYTTPGPHDGGLGYHRIYAVIGTPSGIDEYADTFNQLLDGMWIHADLPVLKSRCIRLPGSVGVDEIKTNSIGRSISSRVYVRDGYNTSFRIENGKLYLTVGQNEGKGFECKDPDAQDPYGGDKYIYSINGERPDSGGNMVIKGGEGITLSSGEYNGIPAVFVKASSLVDSIVK